MKINRNLGNVELNILPGISEYESLGLVIPTSLKKASIVFLGLVILSNALFSTSSIVNADWKYDFAYDYTINYCELAAYYAASCLEYEQYDDTDITSTEYAGPTKSTVTSSLLGTSKLFFTTGHGGHYYLFMGTYFWVAEGETVGASDIPSLTSVHNGGSQLLGYVATCHSGDSTAWADLRDAFISQGSGAYLGFVEELDADDMYHFTCPYFDSLGAGDTVSQALTDALADPDHDLDSGDVVLLGTTSIKVADS